MNKEAFLKWLGTTPSGQAHEFAWEAWKAATFAEREEILQMSKKQWFKSQLDYDTAIRERGKNEQSI